MEKKFMVPMVTPMNEKGVSTSSVQHLFEGLYENNVRDFLLLGTNGEGMQLTLEQKKFFLDVVSQSAFQKKGLNISVVLAASTRSDVACLLGHINDTKGIDSVTLAPNHRPEEDCRDDLNHVLDHTDLPIIGYDLPSPTKPLTEEQIDDLLASDRVVGWKNSASGLGRQQVMRERADQRGEDFTLWQGSEVDFLSTRGKFTDGLVGGTGNVLPAEFIQACTTMRNEDLATLIKAKEAFLDKYIPYGTFVAALKHRLKDLGVIGEAITATK